MLKHGDVIRIKPQYKELFLPRARDVVFVILGMEQHNIGTTYHVLSLGTSTDGINFSFNTDTDHYHIGSDAYLSVRPNEEQKYKKMNIAICGEIK